MRKIIIAGVSVVLVLVVFGLGYILTGETYASCEQKGGEVINTLGINFDLSEYGTVEGDVKGMRCPCVCIVFDSEESRAQFEEAKEGVFV